MFTLQNTVWPGKCILGSSATCRVHRLPYSKWLTMEMSVGYGGTTNERPSDDHPSLWTAFLRPFPPCVHRKEPMIRTTSLWRCLQWIWWVAGKEKFPVLKGSQYWRVPTIVGFPIWHSSQYPKVPGSEGFPLLRGSWYCRVPSTVGLPVLRGSQ